MRRTQRVLVLGFLATTILASGIGSCQPQGKLAENEHQEALLEVREQRDLLEAQARLKDPTYAKWKAERDLLSEQFHALVLEHDIEIGPEGLFEETLPPNVETLLKQLNRATVEMERSEGYGWLIHERAEAALSRHHERRRGAGEKLRKKYYLKIFRDPSVPLWYLDWQLKDYVNNAMSTISSEVWWNTWFSVDVDWEIVGNKVYSYDLHGCGTGSPPGGSGNTFNVYFRYNETGHNGWGSAGSWALIDLSPSWSCGWSWDWDNQAITTHELGHTFGAGHYGYTQCGSFNDKECSGNGCGIEWCDPAVRCVMEYADAGFRDVDDEFCPNDEDCLINFVKYGSVCPAE